MTTNTSIQENIDAIAKYEAKMAECAPYSKEWREWKAIKQGSERCLMAARLVHGERINTTAWGN